VLEGVYVANATPFRDDASMSVDMDAYLAHVDWLAGMGVRGMVPFGTNGEGPYAQDLPLGVVGVRALICHHLDRAAVQKFADRPCYAQDLLAPVLYHLVVAFGLAGHEVQRDLVFARAVSVLLRSAGSKSPSK